MRIAVVGVPRGGTSVVVGLTRILGFRLPPEKWRPECELGEAAGLRWARNPFGLRPTHIVRQIETLPDWTVWKDPAVAVYSSRVKWENWSVIRVNRDVYDVALSEAKWGNRGKNHRAQAEDWYRRLTRDVPQNRIIATLHLEDIRTDPVGALTVISESTGLGRPSHEQGVQARSYTLAGGGYRCPLPATCRAHH